LLTFSSYLTLPCSESISAQSISLPGNRFLIAAVTGLGSWLICTFSWKATAVISLGSRLIDALSLAHPFICKVTATPNPRAIRENICNIMTFLSKPKPTTLGHMLCHGFTDPKREAKGKSVSVDLCVFTSMSPWVSMGLHG